MEFSFSSKLWQWNAKDAWHFITVPEEHAQLIKGFATLVKRGFGSVRIEATVGSSTWKTSVFPDTQSHSYLLPVKKSVRQAEGLQAGDSANVTLKILE